MESEDEGPTILPGRIASTEDEAMRSYQTLALDFAKQNNTIVFLPTGSGKTRIGVELIRHYLDTTARQKVAFLAPRKLLLGQQFDTIKKRMPNGTGVKMFTGETIIRTPKGNLIIDVWNADIWADEIMDCDVLCLTPQIFDHALHHGHLHSQHFSLVIFDECHHCTGKGPMNQVMKKLFAQEFTGRVLGLTASPVKQKGKGSHSTAADVATLEKNMNSRVLYPAAELGRYLRP